MLTEFHYAGFSPDEELRLEAESTLDEILENAPYEAMAVALLSCDGQGQYRCSIDVYSRSGPFIAHATRPEPLQALQQVRSILMDKLTRWQRSREQALGHPYARSRPRPRL